MTDVNVPSIEHTIFVFSVSLKSSPSPPNVQKKGKISVFLCALISIALVISALINVVYPPPPPVFAPWSLGKKLWLGVFKKSTDFTIILTHIGPSILEIRNTGSLQREGGPVEILWTFSWMFLIVFQNYRKIILDIPGQKFVTYVTLESVSGCDFQRH